MHLQKGNNPGSNPGVRRFAYRFGVSMDNVNVDKEPVKKSYVQYISIAVVAIALVIVLYYAISSQGGAGTKYGTTSGSGKATAAAQVGVQQNVSNLPEYDNVMVSSNMLSMLNVPENLSNDIGIGTAYNDTITILYNKSALNANGKPEILYMGAEYCPFCAAERWAMIIALSRFGNFSDVHFMTSSASDYSPSTPTFTFYNSTYTSPYITFVAVEQTTNEPSVLGYVTLQQPTQQELDLQNNYNKNGSIPFILFANRSVSIGAMFDPYSILYGRTWSTVISEIYNASTVQSKAIIGSADIITEQICSIDNNTPKSVCSQPYVSNIRKTLSS